MLDHFLSILKSSFKGSPGRSGQEESAGAALGALLRGKTTDKEQKSVPEWKPGDLIMERYRVEKVMSGSMGKVYICEHMGWGIKIAIKSPRPEVLEDREGMKRILLEANGWIKMGMHPNIAACFYVLSLAGVPHLFIEFIDGGSLDEWIKSGKCRDLRTALSLAIQFCHGMEYTHAKGIIHRDIKPQNILVTKNALLKITDFGILLNKVELSEKLKDNFPLAKDEEDDEATVGFRGTPGFASPEQFRDAHNVDQRTDIFSFGLCLWLMLCGQKPFRKNSVPQEIPEPVPLNQAVVFPAKLVDLLKKCVAYSPNDRFSDFASLRKALNDSYIDLFKVACPYAMLTNVDLRADSLNNRAVSLFELGKIREAATCLNHALEINDLLPEAIHNLLLLKWREGLINPPRLLRQIEAIKQRLPQSTIFNDLETAIRNEAKTAPADDASSAPHYPEFRLCVPKVSLEIFREGQLHQSVQRSILSHFQNNRFKECHNVLIKAWESNGFKKDMQFNKIYEQIIRAAEKDTVIGAQRFLTLPATGCPATCLAHVPGTATVVSAGPDGRVLIQILGSNQEPQVIDNNGKGVGALAVDPDGERLAYGTADGRVSLWSFRLGRAIPFDFQHEKPVTVLAFSPDNHWLVSGDTGGSLVLHGIFSQKRIPISVQDGGALRSIIFLNQRLDMATASDDGNIRLWEHGKHQCRQVIEAHRKPIIRLAASQDSKFLVSGAKDLTVKVWKSSGMLHNSFQAHEEPLTSVLILPEKRDIITGCVDDTIKVWDSEDNSCRLILDGRGNGIASLAQGPRPHTFLAGRMDGAILLWTLIYRLRFK